MKFTLIRRIYFSSPESGLVCEIVAKDMVSDIPPQIGYEYEDSAWHRNDHPKVESVVVNTESGDCIVELEPRKLETAEAVGMYFEVVLQHPGWRNCLK
ncbi:hypothetical protein D3C77_589600 [compost metagenome]